MKVSVILPIYNGEQTLEATLKSLVAQSFQDFELIACIDGTNDGSEEILENYSNAFSKMTVLKNEKNLGLGPTMNKLVYHSDGEYIAIAEQDDYYFPNRLRLQVDLLDVRSEVGLVSGIAEFWDGEKVTFRFPGILVNGGNYPQGRDLFLLNYTEQTKIVNSCMMFRKSTHINNGLYFSQHYPNVPVDLAYFLRFSLKSNIYGLSKTLVRLDRKIQRNSITTRKKILFDANRELLRSFKYEYPEIIDRSVYKKALDNLAQTELRSKYSIDFYKSIFFTLLRNPFKKMPYVVLYSRILKKLNK
jgi:glycosyltransferase involved in cell wall biosynthesis